MNILPKKRWHVRTKDNVARVKRDQTMAAEKERERKLRSRKAESEAQIQFLRHQARNRNEGNVDKVYSPSTPVKNIEHINFFSDLEKSNLDYKKSNVDNEKEKKEEKEAYEKKIGYLTYLGQDTNERLGKTSWYNELRKNPSIIEEKSEKDIRRKSSEDPINNMKKYLSKLDSANKCSVSISAERRKTNSKSCATVTEKNKLKKKFNFNRNAKDELHSKDCKESHSNVEQLRAERLVREQKEKLRTESLLSRLRGDFKPVQLKKSKFCQNYNSQYFPELAKQNVRENYN